MLITVFAAAIAGVAIAGLPTDTDQVVIRNVPATTTSEAAATTAPDTTETEPTSTDAPESTDAPPATDATTTEEPRQVRIAVLGDSWSLAPTPAWPAVATELLADEGVDATFTVDALAITGYVVDGAAGTSFVDRAANVDPDADVVVVFGGFDDRDGDAAAVSLAAASTFGTIRDVAPGAVLVVVGVPWPNDEVPPNVVALNEALRSQAQSVQATFVDPAADSWFTSGDADLIGPDLLHPSAAGQAVIAERLVEATAATR